MKRLFCIFFCYLLIFSHSISIRKEKIKSQKRKSTHFNSLKNNSVLRKKIKLTNSFNDKKIMSSLESDDCSKVECKNCIGKGYSKREFDIHCPNCKCRFRKLRFTKKTKTQNEKKTKSPQSIRISYFFQKFEVFYPGNSNQMREKKIKVYKSARYLLIPAVDKIIRELIKLEPDTLNDNDMILDFKNGLYKDYDISPELISKAKDLKIFINFYVKNDGTLAYASKYEFNGKNNRPSSGHLTFNLGIMKMDLKSIQFNIETTLHEMMHILVFSEAHYPIFNTKNEVYEEITDSNKRNRIMIKTPKVLKFVQNHFGCKEIKGAYLEDENDSSGGGSSGAHWESRLFWDEFMAPSDAHRQVFSGLTIALLNDSGWYEVEEKYAQVFLWGKDAGCSFYKEGCNMPHGLFSSAKHDFNYKKHFCENESEIGCSFDGKSSGECKTSDYSDGCRIFYPLTNQKCQSDIPELVYSKIGENMRKFQSPALKKCFSFQNYDQNRFDPTCLNYVCKKNEIEIHFPDIGSITCKNDEGLKTKSIAFNTNKYGNRNFNIICPVYEIFCNSELSYWDCSNNNYCSGNGVCVFNNCICKEFYSGNDCSIQDEVTDLTGLFGFK